MSRFRLQPSPVQERVLVDHCGHARFVWNKVGWVRFRWSRAVPEAVKPFRITRDRAGRWHVAFATIPEPIPEPGNGEVVGVDRGVRVSAALSAGELLSAPGLRQTEAVRLVRLQRRRAKARRGSNRRAKLTAAIARLKAHETCNTCSHTARESRESQALFRCVACGHQDNADVNAARDIANTAAGRAVAARGGSGLPGPTNREPQLLLLPG